MKVFFKTPVDLKSIFTRLAGEGPLEVCPVELDVVAAAVMSVGGSRGFSMSFTLLCRLARCLLRFEVEFFAVNKKFSSHAECTADAKCFCHFLPSQTQSNVGTSKH